MAEKRENIGRDGLETKLKQWNVDFETIEHPEVFTVEEALPHLTHLDAGSFAKNLFLKDKKKKLFLLCAHHEAEVKLGDVTKLVGASGCLRFADESILTEKLGLRQGAVTLFGLINDVNHDVQLVLDQRYTDATYPKILFHPMVNSASTAITSDGLKCFIKNTGHNPKIIDFQRAQS